METFEGFRSSVSAHAAQIALIEALRFSDLNDVTSWAWSFGDLALLADAIAAEVATRASHYSATIALLLPRSAALAACMLASSRNGLPWLCLDIENPPVYNASLLARFDCVCLVTCQAVFEATSGLKDALSTCEGVQLVLLDALLTKHEDGCGLESSAAAAEMLHPQPLYYVFTSGSTVDATSGDSDNDSPSAPSSAGPKCVAASDEGTLARLRWTWGLNRNENVRPPHVTSGYCRRQSRIPSSPMLISRPHYQDEEGQRLVQAQFQRILAANAAVVSNAQCRDSDDDFTDIGLWKAPLTFVDSVAELLTGMCAPCCCLPSELKAEGSIILGANGSVAPITSPGPFPTVILPEEAAMAPLQFLHQDGPDSVTTVTQTLAEAVSALARSIVVSRSGDNDSFSTQVGRAESSSKLLHSDTATSTNGGTPIPHRPLNIGRLHFLLSRGGITRLTAVPALLSALARYDEAVMPAAEPTQDAVAAVVHSSGGSDVSSPSRSRSCFSNLRHIVSSGDCLTAGTAAAVMRRVLTVRRLTAQQYECCGSSTHSTAFILPHLWNYYGSSETSGDATAGDVTQLAIAAAASIPPSNPLPVGAPLAGTAVAVEVAVTRPAQEGGDQCRVFTMYAVHPTSVNIQNNGASPLAGGPSITATASSPIPLSPPLCLRLRPLSPTGRIIVAGAGVALGYRHTPTANTAGSHNAGISEGFCSAVRSFAAGAEANDYKHVFASPSQLSSVTASGKQTELAVTRTFSTGDVGRWVAVCSGSSDDASGSAPSPLTSDDHTIRLPHCCVCGCGGPVQLQVLGRQQQQQQQQPDKASGNLSPVYDSAAFSTDAAETASATVIASLRTFKPSSTGAFLSLDEVEAAVMIAPTAVVMRLAPDDKLCLPLLTVTASPTWARGFAVRERAADGLADSGATSLSVHLCVGWTLAVSGISSDGDIGTSSHSLHSASDVGRALTSSLLSGLTSCLLHHTVAALASGGSHHLHHYTHAYAHAPCVAVADGSSSSLHAFLPPPLPSTSTGKPSTRLLAGQLEAALVQGRAKVATQAGLKEAISVWLPPSDDTATLFDRLLSPGAVMTHAILPALPRYSFEGGVGTTSLSATDDIWTCGVDSLSAVAVVGATNVLIRRVIEELLKAAPASSSPRLPVPIATFDTLRQYPSAGALSLWMQQQLQVWLKHTSSSVLTAADVGTTSVAFSKFSSAQAGIRIFAASADAVMTSAPTSVDTNFASDDPIVCCDVWGRAGQRQVWKRGNDDWRLIADDTEVETQANSDETQLPGASPGSATSASSSPSLPPSFSLTACWSHSAGRCVDGASLVVTSYSVSGVSRTVAVVGSHACEVTALLLREEEGKAASTAFGDANAVQQLLQKSQGAQSSSPPLLWTTRLPDRVEAPPVMHPWTGLVLVSCYDGCVYGLQLCSGEIALRIPPAGDALMAGNDEAYNATDGGGAKRRRLDHNVSSQSDSKSWSLGHSVTYRPHVEVGEEPPIALTAARAPSASVAAALADRCPLKCPPCLDPASGALWIAGYDRLLRAVRITVASPGVETTAAAGYSFTCLTAPLPLPGSVAAAPVLVTAQCEAGRRSSSSSSNGGSMGRLVIVACTSGHVLAVDADIDPPLEGKARPPTVLWHHQLPGPVFGTPAVASTKSAEEGSDTAVVCVPCADGSCYGLSAVDGSVLWAVKTGAPVFAGPCTLPPLTESPAASPSFLCGSHDGLLRCVSASNGIVVWSSRIASASGTASDASSPAPVPVFASPTVPSLVLPGNHYLMRVVVAAAVDGTVALLCPRTGAVLCRCQLPGQVFAAPVVVPLPLPTPHASESGNKSAPSTSLLAGSPPLHHQQQSEQRLCDQVNQVALTPVPVATVLVGCRDDRLWGLRVDHGQGGLPAFAAADVDG